MSMSKKDFIALAEMMSALHAEIGQAIEWSKVESKNRGESLMQAGRFEQWQRTQTALADFCQSQNPRFMRERWLAYIAGECGPNGGEAKRKVKVIGNTQSAYDSANSTSPR